MGEAGREEYEARIADLKAVKAGRITLAQAQANAETRRKAPGFSRAKATADVSAHVRQLRRDAFWNPLDRSPAHD